MATIPQMWRAAKLCAGVVLAVACLTKAAPLDGFASSPYFPASPESDSGTPSPDSHAIVEFKENLITVIAQQARLATLLAEISSQTGVSIYLWGSSETPVSACFSNLPVEQAIKKLTRGSSHAVIYARNDSGTPPSKPMAVFIYAASAGSGTVYGGPAAAAQPNSDSVLPDSGEAAGAFETLMDKAFGGNEEALYHIADLARYDKTRETRVASIEFLGSIGKERMMDTLVQALDDDEARVRAASVRALGQYGGERALDALKLALRDPAAEVRRAAMLAIDEVDNGERDMPDPGDGNISPQEVPSESEDFDGGEGGDE